MTDPLSQASIKTPEQEAKVRRIALPIAISGAICGLASLTLLLLKYVSAFHPPVLFAVNLSFCSMMIGIGIVFYAKGTPGTRAALYLSIIALLSGFAGPIIFAKQAADFRKAVETQELTNVATLANAARQYAQSNNGVYPPNLSVLLDQKLITETILHSPFEHSAIDPAAVAKSKSPAEAAKYLEDNSDYQYFGADLHLPALTPATATASTQPDAFSKILIVSRRNPIERRELSAAFTNGDAQYFSLEEAEAILTASNEARKQLGFSEVRAPESVERARAQDRADKATGH